MTCYSKRLFLRVAARGLAEAEPQALLALCFCGHETAHLKSAHLDEKCPGRGSKTDSEKGPFFGGGNGYSCFVVFFWKFFWRYFRGIWGEAFFLWILSSTVALWTYLQFFGCNHLGNFQRAIPFKRKCSSRPHFWTHCPEARRHGFFEKLCHMLHRQIVPVIHLQDPNTSHRSSP